MASRIRRNDDSAALLAQPWRPAETGARTGSPIPKAALAPGADEHETISRARLDEEKRAAFAQGVNAGRAQAQSELEDVLRRFAASVDGLLKEKQRLRHEVERDVVELALAIARKVMRRQVEVDEEVLLGLTKAAFEKLNLREVTAVRVHPRFAPRLESYLAEISAPPVIQLLPEASFEEGDVVVETARGSFDSSLETQLEEIQRGLADRLGPSWRNR
jgi:flagellar assembly protein FliH